LVIFLSIAPGIELTLNLGVFAWNIQSV